MAYYIGRKVLILQTKYGQDKFEIRDNTNTDIIKIMTQDKFIALTRKGEGTQIEYKTCYDDRRTMRQNLIQVYDQMGAFVERYLPDRFYLPNNSVQRQNLRWDLFREIVGNLCVHTDFSSGFACFFHVFKDRVVTKNPTRLLPEIPEGELTIQQLSNYTKNPLLVRVFHELHWAEDLGSGTRNILRYAPLYYSGYKIEINSGQQFVFSITYQDENVQGGNKISKENVQGENKMSKDGAGNVQGKMSKDVPELTDDELALPLEPFERQSVRDKKNRRRQAIIGMIAKDSHVSLKMMSEKLDVNIKTIWRDLNELKSYGVIERIGDDFTGEWKVVKKKNDK